MPVKIGWLIPGEVIYQRWWGVCTLDDVRYINDTALEMMAQYPDRPLIHHVANGTGQEKVEGGLSQIRHTFTTLDHPQTGWILLIVDQILLRFVVNIALQIGVKSRIRFMDNVDEWQPFLKERDNTIDWDKLDLEVITQFESEIPTSK